MLPAFLGTPSPEREDYRQSPYSIQSNCEEFYTTKPAPIYTRHRLVRNQGAIQVTASYKTATDLAKDTELLFVSKWIDYGSDNSLIAHVCMYPYVIHSKRNERSSETVLMLTKVVSQFNLEVNCIGTQSLEGNAYCPITSRKLILYEELTATFTLMEFPRPEEGQLVSLRGLLTEGVTPPPRQFPTLTKISKNTMILYGGLGSSGSLSDCYLLRLHNLDTVPALHCTAIVTSSNRPSLHSHIAVTVDDKLLVFGGWAKRPQTRVYSLCLKTFVWKIELYSGPKLPKYALKQYHRLTAAVMGPLLVVPLPYPLHTDFKNKKIITPLETDKVWASMWILDTSLAKASFVYSFDTAFPASGTYDPRVALDQERLFWSPESGIVYTKVVGGLHYQCTPVSRNRAGLHDLLKAVFDCKALSNVRVVAEDQTIHANTLFLAARRRQARTLLSRVRDGRVELDTSYPTARALLYFLYTEELDEAIASSSQACEELLALAVQLKVTRLKDLCQLTLERRGKLRYTQESLWTDYQFLISTVNTPQLSRVDSGLDDSFKQFVETDFIIFGAEDTYPCHRVMLSLRSGYFRGMLIFDSSQDTLSLETYSDRAITIVLDYIYFDQASLKLDIVAEVLALASYLQVKGLVLQCQQELARNINVAEAVGVYELAYRLKTGPLLQFLEDFMVHHVTENFASDDPEVMARIEEVLLRRDSLTLFEDRPLAVGQPTVGLQPVTSQNLDLEALEEELRHLADLDLKLFPQTEVGRPAEGCSGYIKNAFAGLELSDED